ncbi:MAG: type III-B CRISPR module-associated protein Cmr3 [Saprospiraceae bacterium]|nr:type III-B CRISPR module-associated protein Cmr3 [Saprospiraceae bacterium]
MKLQLDALDPLFFRDGRPFALGEESYADGIFPPLPSTVRGALRSMWMSERLGVPDADKDALATASIGVELEYFGLGIAGKPVFPAPLDLFFPKPEKGTPAQPMKLIDKISASSCPPKVSHLFKAEADGKTEPVHGHLLDFETMQHYLNGDSSAPFETIRLSDLVKREHKIGIGRDRETNRTKEGLLFRLVANRFEDEKHGGLSLLVELNAPESQPFKLASHAVLPLGGERRSVTAKTTSVDLLPKRPKIQGELLKIVLLTPALCNAWFPEIPGLTLVAAAVGKPVSVGGWDVLEQQPKPMRRAIPAGSVFLFQAESEAKANEMAEQLHGESLCSPGEDQKNGFGLCLVSQLFNTQLPR